VADDTVQRFGLRPGKADSSIKAKSFVVVF
jgi:hypothetical protein